MLIPTRLYVGRECVLKVVSSCNQLQSPVPVDWNSMWLRSIKLMKSSVTEQHCLYLKSIAFIVQEKIKEVTFFRNVRGSKWSLEYLLQLKKNLSHISVHAKWIVFPNILVSEILILIFTRGVWIPNCLSKPILLHWQSSPDAPNNSLVTAKEVEEVVIYVELHYEHESLSCGADVMCP